MNKPTSIKRFLAKPMPKHWTSLLFAVLTFATTSYVCAQVKSNPQLAVDSTKLSNEIQQIESVLIQAIVSKSEAYTLTNLNANYNLKNLNTGKDIPMMLQDLTSVVSTSDAGNGIGYTGFRVRGSDATRTNITVNGVPINDAESHGTFWVNMPDLASSLSSAVLTKGVGSSTNGGSAFGATLALSTQDETPSVSYMLGAGSFNSFRNTLKLSGNYKLGKTQCNVQSRTSWITSAGFIDRANADLSSYFFSNSFKLPNNKLTIKVIAFGGREKTYQAWWGIPIEKYNLTTQNSTADSQALRDHYIRNSGFSGATYRNSIDSANLFNANPNTYNYYTYKNETDNYQQHHQHLNFAYRLKLNQFISATIYHTFGTGYFEQFRYGDAFSKYNIAPIRIAGDSNVTLLLTAGDLVRQRWLKNNLYGVNINYQLFKTNYSLVTGINANQYYGNHFGRVTEIIALPNPVLTTPHEYYRATGNKSDISGFAKFTYNTNARNYKKNISITADMQVRAVNHTGLGTDNDLREINFSGNYLFFNPKLFLSKRVLKGNLQLGIMRSNKEPSRSDFTDNPNNTIPKPEQLTDVELNYQKNSEINQNWELATQTTVYHMQYKNQLVLTGAVNDVGTALRKNVENSFRQGVEFEFRLRNTNSQVKNKITWLGNVTVSRNVIQNAPVSWLDYATYTTWDTVLASAPIAYSPSVIAGIGFNFNHKNFNATWRTKHVGMQYLDNTGEKTRSLKAYTYSELTLSKNYKFEKNNRKSEINFNVQLNNIFNTLYTSNGYTWGYLYGSRQVIQEVFVFPQAPANIMINIQYKFYPKTKATIPSPNKSW